MTIYIQYITIYLHNAYNIKQNQNQNLKNYKCIARSPNLVTCSPVPAQLLPFYLIVQLIHEKKKN